MRREDPNKSMALANLSIYYTWKNIKSKYNSKKFKISAPTWNNEFDLPDGSFCISGNPAVKTYVNSIKNRISFKIKTGYK